MKELFAGLPTTNDNDLILLDTCFFIDVFVKDKQKDLLKLIRKKDVAMTSFNIEELIHVLPKVKHKHLKDHIRRFLKQKPRLLILDIPVHPGDRKAEKEYVDSVDPYLAEDVPDPSDAVLAAAAIKTHSIMLTKDKHHLFTAILENYLDRWGLQVSNSLKDVL